MRLSGTAKGIVRRVVGPAYRAASRVRDGRIERRYGLPHEAAGIVLLRSDGFEGPDRNSYAPTPWGFLERMLPVAEVSGADVFLDVGCGMGRVMLEAGMHYPFARIEGVELVPRLASSARALLRRNEERLRCRSWEVVTSDVVSYSVPDDVTVAYLYDPFTGSVFDAVMSALEASVERRPRRVRIVYVTPQESERVVRSAAPLRRGRLRPLGLGFAFDYLVCDLGSPLGSRKPR